MVRLLSFPLSPSAPTFVDTPGTEFTDSGRLADGDATNWVAFSTQNHAGTHVDGPWHFNPEGRRITEIEPAEFFFDRPRLIDLAKDDDELITADDLRPHAAAIGEADLLLLRTGYAERWRATDPEHYSRHSPGCAISAGEYLISEFKGLRGIVMDTISSAAQEHLEEGMEYHRVVLGRRRGDRYILLVEDARLDGDLAQQDLGRVIVAPLLLEGQDSGQATVFAEPAR